jgi:hypothetical protein
MRAPLVASPSLITTAAVRSHSTLQHARLRTAIGQNRMANSGHVHVATGSALTGSVRAASSAASGVAATGASGSVSIASGDAVHDTGGIDVNAGSSTEGEGASIRLTAPKDCCCKCLHDFWVRKRLKFDNPKTEEGFADYQTKKTVVLRCCVGVGCFLAAVLLGGVEQLSWFSHLAPPETASGSFLLRWPAAVSLAQFIVGLLGLLACGLSALWDRGRRQTAATAFWLVVLWEALYFAQRLLEALGPTVGLALPMTGPVYPFDKLIVGGDAYGGTATASNTTFTGNPACLQNVTGNVLTLNSSCTFNFMTTSAALMYTGYTDGFSIVFSSLGDPFAIIVMLAACDFVFPTRRFFWMALLPLLTLLGAAVVLVSPASNLNYDNTMVGLAALADHDPTIGVIFGTAVGTCRISTSAT